MDQNILDKLSELKDLLEAGDISKTHYDEQRALLVSQSTAPPETKQASAPVQIDESEPTTWEKYKFLFLGSMVFAPALIVVIYLALNSSSEEESPNSDTVEETNNSDLPILSGATISASSTMGDFAGLSYNASNAIDGDLESWWSPKSRRNTWLKISFETEKDIDGIQIHGGSHYPDFVNSHGVYIGDLFKLNYRISLFKCEFSDGSHKILSLRDQDKIQTISFGRTVSTDWVKIIPLNYYESSKWNDACISEVGFYRD